MKNIKQICILSFCCALFALLTLSCRRSAASSSLSYDPADATISYFGFATNSLYPGLGSARFAVEHLSDTGRISMQDNDSILFGTPLNKVVPIIRYNGVPSAAIFYLGDTSVILTGYDTLDFSRSPIMVRVFAADRKHEKWYHIYPRVHQADPDIYSWTLLSDAAQTVRTAEQQILWDGNRFLFYSNDGTSTVLTTSTDGADWQQQTLTGLPDNCHVRQILFDRAANLFIYMSDTLCYRSDDGCIWEKTTTSDTYRCLTLWTAYNGYVWGVVQDKNTDECHIAAIQSNSLDINLKKKIDINSFAVSDFAATTYQTALGRQYALITGGYTLSGQMTAASWAIESDNDNQQRIILLQDNNVSTPIAGAAVIRYNNQLLRLGGVNADYQFISAPFCSTDNGVSWHAYTDTLHPMFPDNYGLRQQISVLTLDNDIWLFGGRTSGEYHTDVYKGRLNSINW